MSCDDYKAMYEAYVIWEEVVLPTNYFGFFVVGCMIGMIIGMLMSLYIPRLTAG
jgi:hypothetical protein